MAASEIDICNMALTKLGKGTITSFNDGTQASTLCSLVYDTIRDEVLVAMPWAFATRRATLTADATAPIYDYSYAFDLPVDPPCLRVLEIEGERDGYEYVIENGQILSDDSTMKIKYIAQVETTGDFSPMFRTALIARLASELAYTITGSTAAAQALYEEYGRSLTFAGATDGQQGSPEELTSKDLTEIR